MTWIILSLIYGIFNALYMTFNEKNRYNAYVLGIWRGFGIALVIAPFLPLLPFVPSYLFYLILIFQGIMIGIYDSHIFFASAKYGSNTCLGFLTTSVLITTFIWWGLDFDSLITLSHTPQKLLTILILMSCFTISYWHMMKVHTNKEAEKYLYPAVLALALMSIATKFIAIQGGKAYVGVTYYLFVSCFVSGIYNLIFFLYKVPSQKRKQSLSAPFRQNNGLWLIFFSIILITAKTLALRLAENPGYVMAVLMVSPLFTHFIHNQNLKIPQSAYPTLFFLLLLLWQTI